MLSTISTIIVIILVLFAFGLLFAPLNWGYTSYRNPGVALLIVLIVILLLFHLL
jgi:hypothetical protein